MELLYHKKPTVILYWMPYWTFKLATYLVKVPYITLVNLLVADEITHKNPKPYDPDGPKADEPLFPEYPTYQDKTDRLANHVITWLSDERQYQRVVSRLESLKAEVAHGGASQSAAAYIHNALKQYGEPRLLTHHVTARAA